MTSFVFEGVEVTKTGRTATRKVGAAGRTAREMLLVEITPVDRDIGWKKWVDPVQLYTVDEAPAGA